MLGITPAKLLDQTDWDGPRPSTTFGKIFRGRRSYVHRLERDPDSRFFTLRRDFPVLASWLDQRIAASPHSELARLAETYMPVTSSLEAAVVSHLLAEGGCPQRLSPLACGFSSIAVVDPDTREIVGNLRIPAIGLHLGDTPCLVFVNVPMRVSNVPFATDFVVGTKDSHGIRWTLVEIDGEGHNKRRDTFKANRLKLRTVRFKTEEVLCRSFMELWKGRLL